MLDPEVVAYNREQIQELNKHIAWAQNMLEQKARYLDEGTIASLRENLTRWQEELARRQDKLARGGWGGRREGAGAKPLPPEQKARKTAISLSPDIFTKLETRAQETGRSRSKLIEEALRKYL